jgi:hypothetical protein
MLMRGFFAVCVMLIAGAAMSAQGVPRVPVDDFRVLLVAALDSPAGEAHGILIGPMADAITARGNATGPLLIDVTTLRRYGQPGCSRLNVRFSQEGVVVPGAAAPRKQTLDLGLDYCRDGRPPASLS